MRKKCKRRPYQPKGRHDTVLVDTIMSSSREDVQQEDLDLLVTPALAQLVAIEDFGTITVEGFVLLNESNCLVYSLARLLWQGARGDDSVKAELNRICQEAVDKAEASAEVLAEIGEGFKVAKELRATTEQMAVMKAAIHAMETLSPLANRGTFFRAMKEAERMVDSAVRGPSKRAA